MAEGYLTGLQVSGYAPAAGGWVYFYQPGTTVQQTVYQDDAGSTVWAQPITLDQNGRPVNPVYAAQPVRAIFFSSSGAQLLDVARINGQRAESLAISNASWPGETTVDGVLTALGTTLGGTDGNFLPTGTGATQRTVRGKLSERVSVKDFGAVGNGIANDYAAIVAAMTAVNVAGGGVVEIPAGTYVYGTTLAIPSGVSLKGVSPTSSVLSYSGAGTAVTITAINRTTLEDIGITAPSQTTQTGLLATSCSYMVLNRVRVTNYRIGINITDNGSVAATFNRLTCCEVVTDNNAAARSILLAGSVAPSGLTTGTGAVFVTGCALGPSASGSATVIYITGAVSAVTIVGNYNNAVITPGSAYYNKGIWIDSSHTGSRVFAIGNDFSGAVAGVQIDRTTGPQLVDFGNSWNAIVDSSDGNLNVYTSPQGTISQPRPLGGQYGSQTFSGNGTFTPNLGKANFYLVQQNTAATTVTVANPVGNLYPPGGEMILMCYNASAGAVTWSFGTSYKLASAIAPGAGLRIAVTLRTDLNASATVGVSWFEVSRSAAY